MLPNWFHYLLSKANRTAKTSRRGRHRARRRPSHRPLCEELENRLLPTQLFIPTNASAAQGSIIQVPIAVDSLYDPINNGGNIGMTSADMVVNYDPRVFALNSVSLGIISTPSPFDPTGTAIGDGYAPATVGAPFANNGWKVATVTYASYPPGMADIQLTNDGTGPIIGPIAGLSYGPSGGVLVYMNFQVLINAPLGSSIIDLASDTNDGPTFSDVTIIEDFYLNNYFLLPSPNNYGIALAAGQLPFNYPASFALNNPTNGPYDNTLLGALAPNGVYQYFLPADGEDGVINVTQAVRHFAVSAPAAPVTVSAGGAFVFTVTAENPDNSVDTAYNGLVQFSSTDTQAQLPGNSPLSNGVGVFTATLFTSGNQTITATDSAASTFTGTSSAIPVSPGAATHFIVVGQGGQTVVTSGVSFGFIVLAKDQWGNNAVGYTGTVTFATSDHNPSVSLPGLSTLTAGQGTFNATLVTPGTQVIDATDTTTSSITGSAAFSVTRGIHFAIIAPARTPPGSAFAFTVIAENTNNTTSTGYTGTVTFTSSDGLAVLPADASLVSGIGYFAAVLNTLGDQTITATDTATSIITGTSNTIIVANASPSFDVIGPSSAIPGSAFPFTVIAENGDGTTNTGYTGTVHFTSSDSLAVLPADATLTSGIGYFAAVLETPGNQTLTATDTTTNTLQGSSNAIVVAGIQPQFVVTAPSATFAGGAFLFTVTVEGSNNVIDTTYSGTVHFTSSDSLAVLPADATLTSGVGTFSATLETAGSQTLTAADTVASTLTGTSNAIVVAINEPHFAVAAPSTTVVGEAVLFTVTAEGFNGVPNTAYAGTVHFTSSDSLAVLPADATLTSGVGTFSATLETLGNQTLTATDTVASTLTGASNSIAVISPHLFIDAPTSATAGSAFNFTVTVLDASNLAITGYSGTLHFTSSDTQAVLPGNATLNNGVGLFRATLGTAGDETLMAADTVISTLTGTSNPVAVSAGAAKQFAVAAPPSVFVNTQFTYTVTAEDAFNNLVTTYDGPVAFTSSDTAAILPAAIPNNSIPSNLLGDILASDGSGQIFEYKPSGGILQLVQTFRLPSPPPGDTPSRGMIVDSNGNLEVYNGTVTPYLTTVGLQSGTVIANSTFSGWSTQNVPTYGGLAAYGNTVFATNMAASVGAPNGLIAFNINNFSAERFGSGTNGAGDYIQATVGQDGLLYAEYSGNGLTGNLVDVYDPSNLRLVRTVDLTSSFQSQGIQGLSDIAVDQSGDIFAVDPNSPDIFEFDPTGAVLQAVNPLSEGFDSISINASGEIVVSSGRTIVQTDTSLSSFTVYPPANFAGTSSFVALVETPLGTGDLTLQNGTGTFSATLGTAGNQTITATNPVLSSMTGTSNQINVVAAPHFSISAPSTTSAGTAITFTVSALNANSSLNTAYTGTVQFTSSDSRAVLPAAATLTSGVGTFSGTLITAGSQTLVATDSVVSSMTGASNTITVRPTAATQFVVAAPAVAPAGSAIAFTVTAFDQFNNVATGYTNVVLFSSSDPSAVFTPTSAALTSGVGTFSVILATLGTQTLTATDSVTGTPSAASNPITVSVGSATHFLVQAPAAATAGNVLSFTVTAEDPFNNIAVGYTGTVTFSSTDTSAVFVPSSGTLSGGVGVFSVTLETAGFQTLVATDAAVSTVTGSSSTVAVSAAAASHLVVTAPLAATAGTSFAFTVTAEDPFNNPVPSFTGSVAFSTSDSGASTVLPGGGTIIRGVGTFSATLTTAGSQTLTATSVAVTTIAGSSTAITVNASAATHFAVNAPATTHVDVAFGFTVTALDPFNNTATGYGGIVTFASSDTAAVLPGNNSLLGGIGTFSATLATLGNQTLTIADQATSTITGTSGSIAVLNVAGGVTHFVVTVPSTTTAGLPFVAQVIAEDQFNTTAAGYNGTVHFTSTDPQGVLPADGNLTNGVGFFAAYLKTAGNQSIVATDVITGSLTGTSNPIAVSAAAASHFVLTPALPTYPGAVPGPTTFASTGQSFSFTVSALDPYGNVAPTYAGTVHFTSSDTAAGVVLPPNSTLTGGMGTFSASLRTPGTQTLTATDTVQNSGPTAITGASGPFAVRGLVVTSFTTTPTGFTVTFNKPFQPSTVNLYTTGALPDDVILATAGAQVSVRGSVLLNSTASPTSITFVKIALVSSLGTFNPGSGLLAAGNYTVTLRSFNAGSSGFQDALGSLLDGNNSGVPGANFVFTFSVSAPPVAVGIPDFARGPSNTDALFLPTTIGNGNTFNLIYTNPNTTPTTGTATITFSTTAASLLNNIQNALSALPQVGLNGSIPNSAVVVTNDTAAAGANVQITFQGTLAQATNQLLASTTPGVSISLATINAANNITGNGIPIALSSGLNVTSGSFTLQYNPALLNISGAVAKIAGASFTVNTTINNATSATAVLSLSSPSRISSTATAITIGSLLATVPLSATASYGAKQLLHFSSEHLNGTAGPIAVTNQDGVEVAAYLGDVVGAGGPFSLGDATAISAVAGGIANTVAQTIPGFAIFPDLDPAIIGDVSLAGTVNFADASLMNQQLVSAQVKIPYAPIGLPVPPVGPDPTLSISRMSEVGSPMSTKSGADIGLPTSDFRLPTSDFRLFAVNIDTARPQGSTGMVDAMLALTYDPKVFDVSAADVQLGTVPEGGSGWQLNTEVNAQTGLIGVELYSNTPIQSMAGGSLVTIAMHLRGEPGSSGPGPALTTGLTLVPDVDPAGGVRVYQTSVSDAQGEFVVHMEGGQWTVDDRPTLDQAPDVGQRSSNSEHSASALPFAVVEQAFRELAQMAADSLLPTAIFPITPADSPLPNANFATLTASGLQLTASCLPLDGGALEVEEPDLSGLDAFFANEVCPVPPSHAARD